jgi:hypothetical protein
MTHQVVDCDRGEEGIAMIAALMVMLVGVLLSITAFDLANHSQSVSSLDRSRLQAVNAAEAGLDATVSVIQQSSPTALPCGPIGVDLTGSQLAHYNVTLTYYDATGAALACPMPSTPATVKLISTGTAGPGLTISRQMASLVKLVGVASGYSYALYANKVPQFNSEFTLNGNTGNDGSLFTNGNIDATSCQSLTTVHGNLYAAGTVDCENAHHVFGTVWANGSVTLASGTVDGDVVSSTSSLNFLSGETVNHNARAGTTISGSCGPCTKVPSSPQASPPSGSTCAGVACLPPYTYNQSNWTAQGYYVRTYSSCTTAFNDINSWSSIGVAWSGPQLVRITPACTFGSSSSVTCNLKSDLAIITDGGFDFQSNVAFLNASPSPSTNIHKLFLIQPTANATNSCTPSGTTFNFQSGVNFDTNLRTFIYTPCTIDLQSGTPGLTGQVYADKFIPVSVPGSPISSYQASPVYVREQH